MKAIIFLIMAVLSACASKQTKSICDHESGHPNARFILLGTCIAPSTAVLGFDWIETRNDGQRITQGHLVIDTKADNGGTK